jgi:hypothetical protein
MNEDALRAMIRESIARHLGTPQPAAAPFAASADPGAHPSHFRYVLAETPDGRCIIEPNVHCNHCGYCQSHGH